MMQPSITMRLPQSVVAWISMLWNRVFSAHNRRSVRKPMDEPDVACASVNQFKVDMVIRLQVETEILAAAPRPSARVGNRAGSQRRFHGM
jgi:hypothetical protein